MSRPTLEVADIFRAQADNFINKHDLRVQQLKVIRAIVRCRTAALGGHVDVCPRCGGDPAISYDSCRNRHCNKCQAQARRLSLSKIRGYIDVGPTCTWHAADFRSTLATFRQVIAIRLPNACASAARPYNLTKKPAHGDTAASACSAALPHL